VASGAPSYFEDIWAVRDQGAFGHAAVPAQHREPVFYRELCYLTSVLKEERAWYQGDGSGALLGNRGEGGFELGGISDLDEANVKIQLACRNMSFLILEGLAGFAGLVSRVTDFNEGIASLSSSSRFPVRSRVKLETPVIVPPGRAKLAMSPRPTGSATYVKTIGVRRVAFLAAGAAEVPWVTMTSTVSLTSSAASTVSRSSFPSAERHSMMRFWPST
jgi:hypothetical protein